jgi:hypothetical protein
LPARAVIEAKRREMNCHAVQVRAARLIERQRNKPPKVTKRAGVGGWWLCAGLPGLSL